MYVPPHKRSGDFTGPAVRKYLKDSHKNRCVVDIINNLSMFSAYEDDSQEQLIEKKKSLLEKRHDILHCYTCDILELELHLGTGNPIGNIFPDLPPKLKNKTPDIVEVIYLDSNTHVNIYDPQITLNVREGYLSKIQSYTPLAEELRRNGNTCNIYPIVHSPHGNICDAFLELNTKPSDFHIDTYAVAMEDVGKKIKDLTQLIRFNTGEEASIFDRKFCDPGSFDDVINKTPEGLFSYDYFKDQHIFSPIDDIHELAADPEIVEVLRDKKTDRSLFKYHFESIREDPKMASSKYKPTFHVAYCDPVDIPGLKYSAYKIDQQNTMRLLDYLHEQRSVNHEDLKVALLMKIREELQLCLTSTGESNLFKNKTYTGDSNTDDAVLGSYSSNKAGSINEESTEGKQSDPASVSGKGTALKGTSIRGIFKNWDSKNSNPKLKLREGKPYIGRSRSLILSNGAVRGVFYKKSGQKFKNTHEEGRQYKSDLNCPFKGSDHFQEFFDFVSYPTAQPLEIDPLYKTAPGSDSELSFKIKKEARVEFLTYLALIGRTRAYQMAYHTHLICKQLIHYNNINTKDGSTFFLNSGMPNVLHIMLGGTCQRSKDVGRPFFTVFVTENSDWINPVFGNFTVYPMGKKTLIITGWRRLDTKKLMSICDNFHSCISTGFDTYMRQDQIDMGDPFLPSKIKFIYSYRALVGMNTSQRCAELLMDVRYLAMSFCSLYSDIASLIKDKFGPTYPNCFSRWIVNRLSNQSAAISSEFNKPENFLKRKACFTPEGSRDIRTTGGDIKLPSLWTDHQVNCLQDLFDELFVYVHTMKDPASVYYESIKSLNTILKYQNEYNSLPENWRNGIHDVKSFKEMILSGVQVGCWVDVIAYSARMSADNLSKLECSLGINSKVLKEPLSTVESTKAVVPEYSREGPPLKKGKLKEMCPGDEKEQVSKSAEKERIAVENLKRHLKRMGMEILDQHNYQRLTLTGVIKNSPILENTATGRHKVHDAILDHLIRYPDHSNTFDVSLWNIFENSGRVVAHFCIKSQYGPKREFYVVNFGAKCMVRSYESIYKVIAQMLPEEMISEPGDKKLLFMEKLSNEATKCGIHEKIYYCNGDCTKWSACETMPSFMALAHGLRNLTGNGAYEYTMAVLSCWANKKVRIPDELLEGMKYITNKSEYLRDGPERQSTQNFLQGMFNYSSSVKAVFAARLAHIAYNDKYPNTVTLQHLEHSDDYVLVIKSRDRESLETFRVYHKLVQRMHGINDSTKKTNIQEYIMEFISLMSFNGYMAYPNIKKTKEVGLNIAAEGYQRDIMNSVSRSSESVRLGVPLKVAYIQQLIQSVNIYRAYSLVERNKPPHSHSPFDYPTGLFGMPDCLPIAYVNNNADMNNLRIYKYAHDDCVLLLKGLYELSLTVQEDTYDSGSTLPVCLHTPQYSLPKSGKKIKVIQSKIQMTFEKSEKYRNDHPEYLVMKPRHPKLYKEWLEYMYFNSSFAKAYTRVSRANLLLHISHIVSAPCIRTSPGVPKIKLSEYISKIFGQCRSLARKTGNGEGNLMHALTRSNAASQLYTRMMEKTLLEPRAGNCFNTVATQLPSTSFENKLVNGLDTIMQRMVSEERANMDERYIQNQRYWDADLAEIEKLGCVINESTIVQVFKNMKSGQPLSRKYGMALNISSNSGFENYLTCYLENNIGYGCKYFARAVLDSAPIVNYGTGEDVMTLRFNRQKNITTIVLDNACQLYYYYNICEGLSPMECIRELSTWNYKGQDIIDFMGNISEQELGARAYDIKMLTFFKVILSGNWMPVERLLMNKLFYTKCYFDNGTDFGSGKFLGITYMGHQCLFSSVKGGMYMISKKQNLSLLKTLYIMGLHASRKITTHLLQDLMCGKRFYNINLRKGGKLLFNNVQLSRLARIGKVVRLEEDNNSSDFFPFFFTNKPFQFKLGKKETFDATFRLSVTEPTILMGNQKVFGLPLLSTNDMFVLRTSNQRTPLGVSTAILSENALLSHYLTGQQHNEELSNDCVQGLSSKGESNFTANLGFPNVNDIRKTCPWVKKMDNELEHADPPTYTAASRKITRPIGLQSMENARQPIDQPDVEHLREFAQELDPDEGYGGLLGNRLGSEELVLGNKRNIRIVHDEEPETSRDRIGHSTVVGDLGQPKPLLKSREPVITDLSQEALDIVHLANESNAELTDMVHLILNDEDGSYGEEYTVAAREIEDFDKRYKEWEEDVRGAKSILEQAIEMPSTENLPAECSEIFALAQEFGVQTDEMVSLILGDEDGSYGEEYAVAALALLEYDNQYKEWEKQNREKVHSVDGGNEVQFDRDEATRQNPSCDDNTGSYLGESLCGKEQDKGKDEETGPPTMKHLPDECFKVLSMAEEIGISGKDMADRIVKSEGGVVEGALVDASEILQSYYSELENWETAGGVEEACGETSSRSRSSTIRPQLAEISIVDSEEIRTEDDEYEVFPDTSSSEEPEIDMFYFDSDSDEEEPNITIDEYKENRREVYFSVVKTIQAAPNISDYVEHCWEGRTIARLAANPKRMFALLKICIIAESVLGALTSNNYESSCIRALRDTMYRRIMGGKTESTYLEDTGKFKGRHITGIMYTFKDNSIDIRKYIDVTGLGAKKTIRVNHRDLVMGTILSGDKHEIYTTLEEDLDWLPENSFWGSIRSFYIKASNERDGMQADEDVNEWLNC